MKPHTLWRLPLGARLHANRGCDLLRLERTLPSPRDYENSLLESISHKRPSNAPIEYLTDNPLQVASRLCRCARHLLDD